MSMLPFLKNKQSGSASVIMKTRAPDSPEKENENSGDDEGLTACMSELADALHSGDHKSAAKAFRNAARIVDSEPHDEGEHTNDYDDMNELAAKESE